MPAAISDNKIEEDEKEKELNEQTIDDIFANFSKTRLSRSQSAQRSVSTNDAGLISDIAAGLEKQTSKDDVFDFCGEKKTGEFGDNQFWKAHDQHNVDDLLAEMDN